MNMFNFLKKNNNKNFFIDKDKKIDTGRRKFVKNSIIVGAGLVVGAEIVDKVFNNEEKIQEGEEDKMEQEEEQEKLKENASEKNSLEDDLEAMKIADVFVQKYHELSYKQKYFPREVFYDDFLIADQLQESGYKTDAESHKGAVGAMQNMEISIVDVVRGLNLLKRRGEIDFEIDGLDKNEHNPDKIAKIINPEKIKDLITKNQNLSRALGKLYFMMLHGVYEVDKEEFSKKDYSSAQEKLLACYNGGTKQKDRAKKDWPDETRHYVKKVKNYMVRLGNIKNKMADLGIETNDNYARMILARKMDEFKQKDKYKNLDSYLNRIKEEEKKNKGAIDHDLVKKIIRT